MDKSKLAFKEPKKKKLKKKGGDSKLHYRKLSLAKPISEIFFRIIEILGLIAL
jgi:hypothetical protein